MVKERMDLLELLHKGGMDGDVDFLREALRVLVEGIMDAEVSSRIGAEYGERSPERVTQRNGYRSRAWDTRVGTMKLHIPKLREGSYFPSLLEPRRRSERALLAVIQQAYVEGVSTRRVDDLVKALGCEGISKSQVSRICQELDVVVDGFLGRPLDGGPYPYLWLDALTQKVREDGRIVNVSVVVATAVNGEGKREIIGMDVGTSEDGAFWLAFLRSLSARGLSGVELVVSDAHQGLRGAIAAVFGGASWQRCRTHFMTNLLTRVPRRAQPWVATMVRTINQQPSPDEVHAQLDRVTSQLHDRFPEVASLLDEARTLQRVTGAGLLEGAPKSEASRRTIHLGPDAIEVLRDTRARQAEAKMSMPAEFWKGRGHVFSGADGSPIDSNRVSRDFASIIRKAGLPSLMIQTGVHPRAMMEIMGHSSITTTMDTYGHLMKGVQAEAVVGIEEQLRGPSPSVGAP